MPNTPELEQVHMFPSLRRDRDFEVVERIYEARDRHCATSRAPFDRNACYRMLERIDPKLPYSLSTIDRAARRYPHLVKPWPIEKNRRRPWLPPEVELKPEDSAEASPLQQTYLAWTADVDGVPQTVHAIRGADGVLRMLGSLAAMLSGASMLDVMTDGRMDGVVRWCHLMLSFGRQYQN